VFDTDPRRDFKDAKIDRLMKVEISNGSAKIWSIVREVVGLG